MGSSKSQSGAKQLFIRDGKNPVFHLKGRRDAPGTRRLVTSATGAPGAAVNPISGVNAIRIDSGPKSAVHG